MPGVRIRFHQNQHTRSAARHDHMTRLTRVEKMQLRNERAQFVNGRRVNWVEGTDGGRGDTKVHQGFDLDEQGEDMISRRRRLAIAIPLLDPNRDQGHYDYQERGNRPNGRPVNAAA